MNQTQKKIGEIMDFETHTRRDEDIKKFLSKKIADVFEEENPPFKQYFKQYGFNRSEFLRLCGVENKMNQTQITKGYEISRKRCICPTHGFQEKVRTDFVSHRKDMFGFNMDYGTFCLICNEQCKEEKACGVEK